MAQRASRWVLYRGVDDLQQPQQTDTTAELLW